MLKDISNIKEEFIANMKALTPNLKIEVQTEYSDRFFDLNIENCSSKPIILEIYINDTMINKDYIEIVANTSSQLKSYIYLINDFTIKDCVSNISKDYNIYTSQNVV